MFLRRLHSLTGLILGVALVVLALTGAILSVVPVLDKLSAPAIASSQSAASLVSKVALQNPGVAEIAQSAGGRVTALVFSDTGPTSLLIDPMTGAGVAQPTDSGFTTWLTDLHRSFLLGDFGQIAAGIFAALFAVMAISGLALVVRRVGGWRKFFAPLKGPISGRVHVWLARLAAPGLLFSSLTAVFMSLVTFGVIPTGDDFLGFPPAGSDTTALPLGDLTKLQAIPANDFRHLSFPYPGDTSAVYTLETSKGSGYLDAASDELLGWQAKSFAERTYGLVLLLHTGKGAWLLGLLLGISALATPTLAFTGTASWLGARKGQKKVDRNAPISQADTIILVGSETGTTWGFAVTLHKALTEAGRAVHATELRRFDPARQYPATEVIALVATYGEGDPPAGANGFLDKLRDIRSAPSSKLAVVGFGDRQFSDYCAYAKDLHAASADIGWRELIPFDTVDRQSPQDFARIGRKIGAALGISLELIHTPTVPTSSQIALLSRRDYGQAVQAPSAILRFALPEGGKTMFGRRSTFRFRAGDLLGVLPEGSDLPRYYSLASDSRDGFAEICVSKTQGGLCSGQLLDLKVSDPIHAFVRHNPTFRPSRRRRPAILIGAGTGVGPLAGFVRRNGRGRPLDLYFGIRNPEVDYLYREELAEWKKEGKLNNLTLAVSRAKNRTFVQDALRNDAGLVRRLVGQGAEILVCGGRDMADGVRVALSEILAPSGMTPEALKAAGRYHEDVY
jgi:sulfite reductase (NADPH) flavoprotein alpha-component